MVHVLDYRFILIPLCDGFMIPSSVRLCSKQKFPHTLEKESHTYRDLCKTALLKSNNPSLLQLFNLKAHNGEKES